MIDENINLYIYESTKYKNFKCILRKSKKSESKTNDIDNPNRLKYPKL